VHQRALAKAILLLTCLASLLALAACGGGASRPARETATASPAAASPAAPGPAALPRSPAVRQTASPAQAVLLFDIGMHIEPMGTSAQGYDKGNGGDYSRPEFFSRHVQDIEAVTRIVEKHGGRMTIQAQSPFTTAALSFGSTVLAVAAGRGHEIGLHFHEDAHLGQDSSSLSVERWCEVMKQEIDLIKQSSGVAKVRYWSGGNLYPDLYQAARCAGLDVNSDWKDPRSQETNLALVGVNPWRPAGGTDGIDFSAFLRHDPNGPVVFLPEGQYDQEDFASMRRSADSGGDAAYFDYLAKSLQASLEASVPGKVNVFHFTVHPGEFRGDPNAPFAVIDDFLTNVVDPLVSAGRVRWATYSEMADAFAAWEAEHPGEAPR
jgi:hypothetical protein